MNIKKNFLYYVFNNGEISFFNLSTSETFLLESIFETVLNKVIKDQELFYDEKEKLEMLIENGVLNVR